MRYLYVIKSDGDYYKIGIATNVSHRLKQLQTSSAAKLYVVCTVLFKDALKVEQELHVKLKNYRTGGGTEWFNLNPEQLIKVLKMIHEYPRVQFNEHTLILATLTKTVDRLESKLNNVLRDSDQRNLEVRKVEVVQEAIKSEEDEYNHIKDLIIQRGRASTSLLQRELRIGYSKAARYIDRLEQDGLIGPMDNGFGNRGREVLNKL